MHDMDWAIAAQPPHDEDRGRAEQSEGEWVLSPGEYLEVIRSQSEVRDVQRAPRREHGFAPRPTCGAFIVHRY